MGAGSAEGDPVAAVANRLLDAFNAIHRDEEVDVAGIVGTHLHPEVVLVPRYAATPEDAFRGREGVIRFLEESRRQFRGYDVRFELEQLYGEGERRAAVYEVVAQARDSQAEARQRMGAEVEVRDGMLYRMVVHADPRDAFRAAGLDPE